MIICLLFLFKCILGVLWQPITFNGYPSAMLVNTQLSGKWPFRVLPSSLIHLTLKTSASHPMKIFSVVLFILYIFFFCDWFALSSDSKWKTSEWKLKPHTHGPNISRFNRNWLKYDPCVQQPAKGPAFVKGAWLKRVCWSALSANGALTGEFWRGGGEHPPIRTQLIGEIAVLTSDC